MRFWVLPASGLAGAAALQRSVDTPSPEAEENSLFQTLNQIKSSDVYLARETADADKAAKYYQGKLAEFIDGGKSEEVTAKREKEELERNHISEWETELAQVLEIL